MTSHFVVRPRVGSKVDTAPETYEMACPKTRSDHLRSHAGRQQHLARGGLARQDEGAWGAHTASLDPPKRPRLYIASQLWITQRPLPATEILAGVRAVAEGESALSPSVATRLVRHVRTGPPEAPAPPLLTPRELDVLRLVATGLTNAEIGRACTSGRRP